MRARGCLATTILCAVLSLGLGATTASAKAVDGACCLAHGSCLDGYEGGSCGNIGGAYQGDGTDCSSVTCQAAPCGESGSPVCGGTCPAGTRCIDTEDLRLSIAIIVVNPAEEGQSPASCGCVEVLCGGVPIENGQGCCKGTPFTIGVQGCCNGEVVPVDSECFCEVASDNAQEPAVGPPVDLRETGCCEVPFPPLGAQSSTENGGFFDTTFNIAEQGCCERQVIGDDFPEEPFIATHANYTFATGFDCCPAAPLMLPPGGEDIELDLLDALGLCLGGCSGGECASQDCCTCGEPGDFFCVAAGSRSSCEAFCDLQGLELGGYVESAMCTEDGCVPSAAPAPAASRTGLVMLLLALVAVGGFAMLRGRQHKWGA